jgi:FkbH-like protein
VKLAEALSLVQKASVDGAPCPLLLACGFSPLHLQTFLAAHLQLTGKKVRINTGLYGSLAHTLEQIPSLDCDAGAIFIEWPDLDARLGYRSLGGWGGSGISGVIAAVEATLARLTSAIANKPASFRLVVSLPTLALPPGFHTVGWQASAAELALENALSGFAGKIAGEPTVLIVSRPKLDAVSPVAERYDFRSDLIAGFPYSLKHTDLLAEAVAKLLNLPAPKKGLISDLDDTMWRGIVGEEGADGVAWDLAGHAQIHGLYQQMLQSLADQGVLIGIASKNDAAIAEQALQRSDFVLKREKIFPVEIHWEAKSGSVSRILKTWNIAADSVVFVDDSPMELEEVRAAHPGIECLLFPKSDYGKAFALLRQLRDLFGKPALSEEDGLRLESIRNSREFLEAAADGDLAGQFLASAEATLTLEWNPPAKDTRVLDLVNKTNQFNLNGQRFTEAEWQRATSGPDAFVAAVSYQDKFGPLGKIAVLSGRKNGDTLKIEVWVMSCRAFSRRIEYQQLHQLFEQSGAREIEFAYAPTPKNAPTLNFLMSILGEAMPSKPSIARQDFADKCPALYHQVANRNEETLWTTLKTA